MFDLGMMELLVIGIVALIVIGPKDLPGMFRAVGNFIGKMKGMAREFQRSMDQAAKESGIDEATSGLRDATSSLKSATNFNPLDFDKDHGKDSPPKAKKAKKAKPSETPASETKPEAAKESPPAKKPAKKPSAKKPSAKKATAKKKPESAKGTG